MIQNIIEEATNVTYVENGKINKTTLEPSYAHHAPNRDGISINTNIGGVPVSNSIVLASILHGRKSVSYDIDSIVYIYATPIIDNRYYYTELATPPTKTDYNYLCKVKDDYNTWTYDELSEFISTIKNKMIYIITMSEDVDFFSSTSTPNVMFLSLRSMLVKYRPSYNNISILSQRFKMPKYTFDDFDYKRDGIDLSVVLVNYEKLFKKLHDDALTMSRVYDVPYCMILFGDGFEFVLLKKYGILSYIFECPYNVPINLRDIKKLYMNNCILYDVVDWVLYSKKLNDSYDAMRYIIEHKKDYSIYPKQMVIDGCVITDEQVNFDDNDKISIMYGPGKFHIDYDSKFIGCVLLRADHDFCALGGYKNELYEWNDSVRYLCGLLYGYKFSKSMDSKELGYYYIKRELVDGVPRFKRVGYINGIPQACRYNFKGEYVGRMSIDFMSD